MEKDPETEQEYRELMADTMRELQKQYRCPQIDPTLTVQVNTRPKGALMLDAHVEKGRPTFSWWGLVRTRASPKLVGIGQNASFA